MHIQGGKYTYDMVGYIQGNRFQSHRPSSNSTNEKRNRCFLHYILPLFICERM